MIAVVTDSTACLPADLIRLHGIRVIPLHLLIEGVSYAEEIDLTAADVASSLRRHQRVSTSKPSAGDFLDLYGELADGGATAIVSVHLSSEMSGTHSSAVLAAAEATVPVTVVDSRSLGMALGWAVVTACEAVAAGRTPADAAALALRRAQGASAMFYVDTLEYLRRGGRIGRASALVGSALAIKPLLQLTDGQVAPLERVRTSAKALARLEERTLEHALAAHDQGVDVSVQHLDDSERADALCARLAERLPEVGTIRQVELGAVIAAHVGPGTIGTVVSPRLRTEPPVIGATTA